MAKLEDYLWKILYLVQELELTYKTEELMKELIEGDNHSVFSKKYARRELSTTRDDRKELKYAYYKMIGKRYYHVGDMNRQIKLVKQLV